MRTFTFEIDDKSYTLKYGYNSICDLEEESNKPIQNLLSVNEIGFSTIRLVIWAGLRWRNNGYTKQQVGFICEQLNDRDELQEIGKKAIELLVSSVSKGGNNEDKGE